MVNMDVALKEMMLLDGAIGAAVVDYGSGMPLGMVTGPKDLDIEIAAAGTTEVIRAKIHTIEQLGLNDSIEDVLITLGSQYHILRPSRGRHARGVFLYLALDRGKGNLALARHRLKAIEEDLEV
ncbi:hypothetical protein AB0L82_31840 [Nocardia sp. NPDC052001]|uniref:hypothetical protein n=1 Tax=Nocardia sp. NPDC052001 TaxID=3154853 RepID=UPI00343935D7